MIGRRELDCARLVARHLEHRKLVRLNDTVPCVPGMRKAQEICARTFLALMNSPWPSRP